MNAYDPWPTPNHMKAWLPADEEVILNMWVNGAASRSIAVAMGRTIVSIRARLEKLLHQEYDSLRRLRGSQRINLVNQIRGRTVTMGDTLDSSAKLSGSTNEVPYEERVYVFGRNATSMSSDELIQAIQRLENERKNLVSIATKSQTIADKILALETAAVKIAQLLDKRK